MLFCAMIGSSVATTAVLAGVSLPLLLRRGFSKDISCGTVAAASVGTLIPPSIGIVVFAVITGESIAELFIAAIIPSVILFGLYFVYIIVLSTVNKKLLFEKRQIPSQMSFEQITRKNIFSSFKVAIWGILPPIIILGGIYLGVYTPTEAAAVLVVYSIIVSVLVKRIKWQDLARTILVSTLTSTMILCIIFSAKIFALVTSQLQISANLVAYAKTTGMGAEAVVGMLAIILIILGLFLDAASIFVTTIPIFFALTQSVGINPLWLCIFYIIVTEVGLLTPPVGLNLFIIRRVSAIPLSKFVKGALPFLLLMILTEVIIFLFPQLVTWLPNTMS